MMLIIVVLHMIQVFIYGAYKKPREATWMVGVTLLLITLAFGLTGYLLPWDNRAYWGTVVTTQIASQAPIAGPYLLRLLGSQGSRWQRHLFAILRAPHRAAAAADHHLIGIHIYLVRKHGVAAAPGDTAPKRKFFPEQVFKDTVGVAIAFIIPVRHGRGRQGSAGALGRSHRHRLHPPAGMVFLVPLPDAEVLQGPLETVGSVVLAGSGGAHALPDSLH
jgi:ubiquinol-cytochrome c reductase cytochrome b subunit